MRKATLLRYLWTWWRWFSRDRRPANRELPRAVRAATTVGVLGLLLLLYFVSRPWRRPVEDWVFGLSSDRLSGLAHFGWLLVLFVVGWTIAISIEDAVARVYRARTTRPDRLPPGPREG